MTKKNKDTNKVTENIIEMKYEDEMKKSYIDYSMSVIMSRALPDIRDGLKPVHRRILVEMDDLKLSPTGPYRKSARIVGNVLGKLHPHGDSSVYDAMVRMSQDFNMLMPLVDGHGNFGSIDGDSAAAMRYTEGKLTPIAMEFLSGIKKDIVDTKPNFDETLQEPVVLPCRYPNLLVNGSSGIAVGMSTNIPSHNLGEVIDASIALIDDNSLDTKGIMKYIKGPDFPTCGIVANKSELLNIYTKGNGSIRIRGKVKIEKGKGNRESIIITEIPFTLAGNKLRLIEDIIKLMQDKRLPEVSNVSDESSKEGIRIVVELRRNVDTENVLTKLYNLTKLEDTFPVNLLAIKEGSPRVFNLKEMLESYIDFLREINIKELNYDLNSYYSRKEILDGLIKSVDMIDLIIETIRGSKSVKSVAKCLVDGDTSDIDFKTKTSRNKASKFNFTKRQAEAILSMQLQRLVGLEIEGLNKERDNIGKDIKRIEKILGNKKELDSYIKTDLLRIKDSYKIPRKTKLSNVKIEKIKKEEETKEDYFVFIDKLNYVKLIDRQSYARISEDTIDDYKEIIDTTNMDSLFIFTDDGEFYKLKVSDIPNCRISDKGTPIEVLLDERDMSKKRKILHISSSSNISEESKVVYVTLKGLVKLVDIDDYINTNRKNIFATKLNKEDKLIKVSIINEEKEIEIRTENNRALRFMLEEVVTQGRNARGVKGIDLNIGDEVREVIISKETKLEKRKMGRKGVINKN